jgi:ATP-dependent helicase/nuclease subunit A
MMSETKLTEAQRAAVGSRGSSVLVSAAAGSGKTKVIVERLMSYLSCETDPKDIDAFLIITYTKAAAAELRSRIIGELGRKIAEDPGDRRLIRQSNLCYRAQIGTIHSFCTGLLRENSHLLGIPADFKVMDDDRASVMKEAVLEKLLELRYEKIAENEGFRQLVDTVGAGRDDTKLIKVTLSLHEKMQSHPYPEDWAASQIKNMDLSGGDIGGSVWGRELMDYAMETAEYWICVLYDLIAEMYSDSVSNAPIIDAYGESIKQSAEEIQKLKLAISRGYDNARERLPISFPRLKSLRNFENGELPSRIKALRDDCKKAMGELNTCFSSFSAEQAADMISTRPAMEALLRLALDFDGRTKRKSEGRASSISPISSTARSGSSPTGRPAEKRRLPWRSENATQR